MRQSNKSRSNRRSERLTPLTQRIERKNMKRTLMILTFCSAIAVAAHARGGQQKPATDTKPALPTADQILDKYVQAIGGKAAVEKQTSRVAKGSFEIPAVGASGTAE